MIDKLQVMDIIHNSLEGTDKFLVEVKITTDNRIYVSIDGDNGIVIDDCIELSRQIESHFDRDVEDFELNVASAGLDTPLKLTRQYKKNVGHDLGVTTLSGEKFEGTLSEATDENFTLHIPGKKKADATDRTFNYNEVKTAKVLVRF